MADRVTVAVGVGWLNLAPDSEITFGGGVGVDVLDGAATTQVSVQAGVGYVGMDPITSLRFPIGVAIKRRIETGSANVTPWVMPRLDISRTSNGSSNTETNLGASGGVGITMPGGFGIHAALDFLRASVGGFTSDVWTGGIGAHYVTN